MHEVPFALRSEGWTISPPVAAAREASVSRSVANDPNESNWGHYLGYGLVMAVGVVLGVIVGNWLDHKYGWSPWGVVAGAMIGLAAGMYQLIKDALRMNRD